MASNVTATPPQTGYVDMTGGATNDATTTVPVKGTAAAAATVNAGTESAGTSETPADGTLFDQAWGSASPSGQFDNQFGENFLKSNVPTSDDMAAKLEARKAAEPNFGIDSETGEWTSWENSAGNADAETVANSDNTLYEENYLNPESDLVAFSDTTSSSATATLEANDAMTGGAATSNEESQAASSGGTTGTNEVPK